MGSKTLIAVIAAIFLAILFGVSCYLQSPVLIYFFGGVLLGAALTCATAVWVSNNLIIH